MIGWRNSVAAVLLATSLAGCAGGSISAAPAAPGINDEALNGLLNYLQEQKTTGFLVIRNNKVLVERNWPAPKDRLLPVFTYGTTANGQLLEDVASQQKSFVSVLVAQAIDRGLIDPARPLSSYVGRGWSKASPDQEAAITVDHVLTMSSGLDDSFGYRAPAGTLFHYNTPVYAMTKPLLEKVTGRPLADLTREWLTAPLGMTDTAWRQRPAALADVGNATGLVTTPRDIARFGAMILAGGLAPDGKRVVSRQGMARMLTRSSTNPSYGRLWWLNGGAYKIGFDGKRHDEQLVPSAPRDMIAALGALDRKLYVVPSQKLIIVRTGAAAPDISFDETLWRKLLETLRSAQAE